MKPLTREWVGKAEGDWHTALRELRARTNRNPDAACFHAQQCAEKYLKALLQENGIAFPRAHALELLLGLLDPTEPSWTDMRSNVRKLSEAAVAFRYPGESADIALAREAVATCREVRRRARLNLGLGATRRRIPCRRGRGR
jgi:HEPN domain-containing protein